MSKILAYQDFIHNTDLSCSGFSGPRFTLDRVLPVLRKFAIIAGSSGHTGTDKTAIRQI
jgi:hypothetical protein